MPVLKARQYKVSVNAAVAEDVDYYYCDQLPTKKLKPFLEGQKVILVMYHTRPNEGTYEVLDTVAATPGETQLQYPCRLFWENYSLLLAGVRLTYPHYPGMIAFTKDFYPTIVCRISSFASYNDIMLEQELKHVLVFKLVFYPRSFPFDDTISTASGLMGEAGTSLYTILDKNLPELVRSIERSKDLTEADRTMVFEQLLDLLAEYQRLREPGGHADPVVGKATRIIKEALNKRAQ